jgi:hypothetical protein
VLSPDFEDPPLLIGFNVSGYGIGFGNGILGHSSFTFVYIREGEVVDGGWYNFFSYLMLSGSIILGFGSKNYLWFGDYDDVVLFSGGVQFSFLGSMSLRFVNADFPLLSGLSFLIWGSGLGAGNLEYLVLCLVNPLRNVLEVGRWDNSSIWFLLFGLDNVIIEEDKLWLEDTYVPALIIEAQFGFLFSDKGFALGICYYVCFYGNGCVYGIGNYGSHACTTVLNSETREVECLWSVGVKSLFSFVSINYDSKEISGLGLGYIGYSGVLFGLKMEPSWRELKQIL